MYGGRAAVALFAVAGEWGQKGSRRGRRAPPELAVTGDAHRARATHEVGGGGGRASERPRVVCSRFCGCGARVGVCLVRFGKTRPAHGQAERPGCVSAAVAANGGGPPMTRGPGGRMVPPVGRTGALRGGFRIRGAENGVTRPGVRSPDPSRSWLLAEGPTC